MQRFSDLDRIQRSPFQQLTCCHTGHANGKPVVLEDLSPAFTAAGANFWAMPLPAENSAISTSSNARRTRVRQRFKFGDAKPASVHGGDEFRTNGTGYTGNGNDGIVLHFSGLHNKKAPDLFLAGLRFQMMRSSGARTPPDAPLCAAWAGVNGCGYTANWMKTGICFNEVESGIIVTQ